jgi:cell division topological specificity factor
VRDLIYWLRQFFTNYEPSGQTARKRLQLVLMQDRIGLTQGELEAMKMDLLEVVSKYLVIEPDEVKIEVKNFDSSTLLLSSIPVKDIVRPPAPA